MNRAFSCLLEGAELIALARNRMYRRDGSLVLDVGAFVAALEYATGKQAVLVGKPSPAFFHLALDSMGVDPSETAVVGDDIESDVGGAQAAGLLGVLVRTGKFRGEDLERSSVRPDAILSSLADVGDLL
jgi:HAD superfamily hydrolase (TIGR01458 family)